jgi:hypothetical protein
MLGSWQIAVIKAKCAKCSDWKNTATVQEMNPPIQKHWSIKIIVLGDA